MFTLRYYQKWRGAAPVQRCILEGDQETGVTIMKVEKIRCWTNHKSDQI